MASNSEPGKNRRQQKAGDEPLHSGGREITDWTRLMNIATQDHADDVRASVNARPKIPGLDMVEKIGIEWLTLRRE